MDVVKSMPCLDMKNGSVVKGVQFVDLRDYPCHKRQKLLSALTVVQSLYHPTTYAGFRGRA
jgi:hypothetical protein